MMSKDPIDQACGISLTNSKGRTKELSHRDLLDLVNSITFDRDFLIDIEDQFVDMEFDDSSFDKVAGIFNRINMVHAERLDDPGNARMVIAMTYRLFAARELYNRDWMDPVVSVAEESIEARQKIGSFTSSARLTWIGEDRAILFDDTHARAQLEGVGKQGLSPSL